MQNNIPEGAVEGVLSGAKSATDTADTTPGMITTNKIKPELGLIGLSTLVQTHADAFLAPS